MTHLNDIQQACTNLSSGTELVAGVVYGMRQWMSSPSLAVGSTAFPEGLYGHNWYRWSTGVNTAACAIRTHIVQVETDIVGIKLTPASWERDRLRTELLQVQVERLLLQYPDLKGISFDPWLGEMSRAALEAAEPAVFFGLLRNLPEGRRLTMEICLPARKHEVTDPICTCGFYAYTDLQSLNHSSRTSGFFGIIKAWGLVTQGTKGFRAQHAEIVGLTPRLNMAYSPYGGFDRWSPVDITTEWDNAHIFPHSGERYDSLEHVYERYKELTK